MFHGKVTLDIAKAIKTLRGRIEDARIPPTALDETIKIATWNVREFGKKRRSKKAIHLIAEVMSQFDLIGLVEPRDNLRDLRRVMDVLGPYWKVVFSDYIKDWGGNRERMAYLYDSRALAFTGLAAEVDAPRKKNRKTGEYTSKFSWWRRPFMASFSAGNFDFVAITAHIRWGDGAKERIRPLQLLADWIDTRRKDKYLLDKDFILMGDFNIPNTRSALFEAITGKGLHIPNALLGAHGTNLARDKRYDQILHYPQHTTSFTNRAGVLDFYRGNPYAFG